MNELVAPVSIRHLRWISFTKTVINDNGDGLIIDVGESPSDIPEISF